MSSFRIFTPQEVRVFEPAAAEGADPRTFYTFENSLLPEWQPGLGFNLGQLTEGERLQHIQPLTQILSKNAYRALYSGAMGGILSPMITSFDIGHVSLSLTHDGTPEAQIAHQDIALKMARATGHFSLRDIEFRQVNRM